METLIQGQKHVDNMYLLFYNLLHFLTISDDDVKQLPMTAMFYAAEEQLHSLFRAFDSDGMDM